MTGVDEINIVTSRYFCSCPVDSMPAAALKVAIVSRIAKLDDYHPVQRMGIEASNKESYAVSVSGMIRELVAYIHVTATVP